ncbi:MULTISPECIES: hypothetical protein [unclassified Kitasatospora]|uniref:hypothetical protein n=1 Tax=unclassified Kitasatospora TaxID=2633591 RepID=UPI001ADF5D80|nr:hypothetical protein [Kitasatospora sp. RG8]MBP0449226.1 hypothetical protein [Kitasatospora sp. RG8]
MGEYEERARGGAGRWRLLLGMIAAAAAIGGLLGGAVSLFVYLFTDWFDPIAEFAHDHCIRVWGGGCRRQP